MRQVILNLFCFLVIPLHSGLQAQNIWNLPADLNDTNTNVKFEVDSTWHLIKGTTKSLHGRAWLEIPTDFASIRADLSLPVPDFDTGSRSRDKRMREVMHADLYPEVKFVIADVNDVCDPNTLQIGDICHISIDGNLSINNSTHRLTVPAEVTRDVNGYIVKGKLGFNWADYGVEDPSIFIAKLDPSVAVTFTINLFGAYPRVEEDNAQRS